jgi:hypothetical protein
VQPDLMTCKKLEANIKGGINKDKSR